MTFNSLFLVQPNGRDCLGSDLFESSTGDITKYVDMAMADEMEDAMLDADMENELLADEDDLLR